MLSQCLQLYLASQFFSSVVQIKGVTIDTFFSVPTGIGTEDVLSVAAQSEGAVAILIFFVVI